MTVWHDTPDFNQSHAHHLINERVSRAAAHQLPPVPRRHLMALRLRRLADAIDL